MPRRKTIDAPARVGHALSSLMGSAKKRKVTTGENKFWTYRRSAVPVADAARHFAELAPIVETAVKKHGQPKVVVAGQSFEQRRLVAYFSKTAADYTYS